MGIRMGIIWVCQLFLRPTRSYPCTTPEFQSQLPWQPRAADDTQGYVQNLSKFAQKKAELNSKKVR